MRYEKRQLERLHAELLDILAEVIRVCDLHGIPYFIQGGTAIGALFNRGIVPWDDDIDLGMTRENYDRFLEVAPSTLRPGRCRSRVRGPPGAPGGAGVHGGDGS